MLLYVRNPVTEAAVPFEGMSATRGSRVDPAVGRRWVTFSVLTAMAALTILDVSKVGVALPDIQASLHGSDTSVQLMVVGYTVVYAVFLLPSGRIGDIMSRKAVFLVGAVVFLAASIWCALAVSPGLLIVGRMIQGAGAGILMPQVLGIVQRLFPAGERAMPLAILAATTAITASVGPVIAGAVIQLAGGDLGWRLLFCIDIAGTCVAIPLIWRLLADPRSTRAPGFDRRGAELVAGAIVLIVIPVSLVSKTTPFAWWMAVCVAAGACLFALFVRRERDVARRSEEALVDLTLFRIRAFWAGTVVAGLAYANGTAGALVTTLFYEEYARESPLATGAWMLPSAAAMVAGSWIAGRVPMRSNRRLIVLGSAIGGVGFFAIAVLIATIGTADVAPILAVVLFVKGLGGSLAQPPNQVRSLQHVPAHRSSVAASIMQVSQRIGSAFGMALALILYYEYRSQRVPGFGAHTLGPTLAEALCGTFSLLGAVVALVDADPSVAPAYAPAPLGELVAEGL
jgi:MFS family permease